MKTDRELLGLAAKAAGILVKRSRLDDPAVADMLVAAIRDGCATFIGWNPLTDDGDALRLAVKLRINVEFFNSSDTVFAQKPRDAIAEDEWLKSDPYAATRRAIVRAAAAIGEAMP